MVPFYWMFATALKGGVQLFELPPSWVPNPPVWENFAQVFREVPFGRFLINSVILVTFNIVGQVHFHNSGRLWICTVAFSGEKHFVFNSSGDDDGAHPGDSGAPVYSLCQIGMGQYLFAADITRLYRQPLPYILHAPIYDDNSHGFG